ncbi:related to human transcription regulator Staf-5 [Phialocephala subalpina]|uniref:Related to human transcription regulator Staf-5 n=1 Tax=Phialocephala subalpina TaxID=576137 RepID=A0A1L7XWS5_9HELO|nr:related to human transcription regulator Staf-5 [Phialocephala subalpina]
MNSVPPNALSSAGGKLINPSSSHSPIQHQQQQVTSPSFESRRSASHSNQITGSPRNSQGQRNKHKNLRRPRLGVDEDAMAESGAMRNANSRRGQTSITHLMNFTLPPRPQDYRSTMQRGTRRGNIYGIGSGHHSSDKARYIHANYRFIVKPYGDYKPQAINADQHLEWNDVLQILASSVSQDASCPICLSHPVAPRMAKCGHIFCLPCMIRYMHSSDDANPVPEKKARWKKCPICWDSVYMSETRPVRWYTGQENVPPREGDDVVLRLVMRQPGSTLALPRDGADVLGKNEDVPWYFAAEVTDYARIMKGSEEYMVEQYDAEIEDLQRQENEDELMFGEEPEWTRKAVNTVREAKEKIKGIGDPPAAAKQPAEKPVKRQPIQFTAVDEDAPEMYFIQNASRSGLSVATESYTPPVSGDDSQTSQPSESKPIPSHPRSHNPRYIQQHEGHHPDAPYFFYQALLHYYLAPLDIRILKSAFGSFAAFPSTLLPRLERVSTGHIMDDDLRKRTKYLSHLPYGCEVGFLECNWTDVVPPEILDQFKDEIEKRRKRNREKEVREERDRVRAEKAEDDARWAMARKKHTNVPVSEGLSGDDFHPLAPSSLDASGSSPPWPARQGSSFATLASPSTSPSAPRTVWGTAMVSAAASSPEVHPQEGHSEVDDGWLHSWEQELQAENELIAQVQAASLDDNSRGTQNSSFRQTVGQGKKKKAKKITLMSTTARRAA